MNVNSSSHLMISCIPPLLRSWELIINLHIGKVHEMSMYPYSVLSKTLGRLMISSLSPSIKLLLSTGSVRLMISSFTPINQVKLTLIILHLLIGQVLEMTLHKNSPCQPV